MSTQATPAFPATTPEVTINNTAAEIKAVIDSQAAPVESIPQPPPAPVEAPAWGQLSKGEDGTYQVTLATGEVFKGTADEVIAKQAEAHVNTKRWAQELKQKAETVQPPAQVPPQPPTESPEELQARQWVVEQMAKALNIPTDKFVQMTNQMYQNTVQNTVAVTYADFMQQCPDFVDTKETTAAMTDYLPPDVISQQRAPTVDDFKTAHALALYNKRYAPAQQQTQVSSSPVPPVMPSSGTGAGVGQANPWAMPLSELKKLI